MIPMGGASCRPNGRIRIYWPTPRPAIERIRVRVRTGGRLCYGPPVPLEALWMGLLVYRRFPAYAFLTDVPHRALE